MYHDFLGREVEDIEGDNDRALEVGPIWEMPIPCPSCALWHAREPGLLIVDSSQHLGLSHTFVTFYCSACDAKFRTMFRLIPEDIC